VGDCALLKNPDSAGEPFVARILKIYTVKEPLDDSEGFCTVQWFYRPSDVPVKVRRPKG
jgi:hypothetical protein